MQTNTNKRRRRNIHNITDGRVGPSNIIDGGITHEGLKWDEFFRGSRRITKENKAVGIIQKYMRFWFSEIGKLIRNSRNLYAYLIE